MPTTLQPLKRAPLLHIEVQTAIKDYIQRHQLKPNDALPSEGELARALEVGRNSVREAVKALESMGILETRRGSGIFVSAFSFEPLLNNLPYGLMGDLQDIAELLEIRRILELAKIASAIECLTDEQVRAFDEILNNMKKKAKRGESFPEEDRSFHRLLFQNLGNNMLLKLIDIFWLAIQKASLQHNLADPQPMQTYHDHVAIVEALKAHNIDQAVSALDGHYDGISARLKSQRI